MESLLYVKRPIFVPEGLKCNRQARLNDTVGQAFQCLIQKVEIYFTSRRDRMKNGTEFEEKYLLYNHSSPTGLSGLCCTN